MGDDRITFRLGDVCTKIGSGATPRGGSSVYLDSGEVALIRSQNVFNDGFHYDGLAYLGTIHADQLAHVEVEEDDVLLNITGESVARSCQVVPGILPARVNQHVAIVRTDPRRLWPRYLRYFFITPYTQAHLLQLASAGATRKALTKGMIESLEITVPREIKEQQAIACILGAFDDKIELNRRMNATLEAMARAIFKSWFVDFDPVRAKAAGEQPAGLSPEIAALFPDSFEDSELGEIPAGWKIGLVRDLGAVTLGKTPPTADHDNYGSDFPFVTIPDMHGKVFVTKTTKSLSKKGAETQKKKTLPPFSICVSCIATPGLVVLTSTHCQTNQQINSVMPFDANASLYTYFVLRGLGERIRTHGAGGSVLLNLNKGQFSSLRVILPPKAVVRAFQKVVMEIFQRILHNDHESETLKALRDTLLPRLISGELRVPDAERIVGSCV